MNMIKISGRDYFLPQNSNQTTATTKYYETKPDKATINKQTA